MRFTPELFEVSEQIAQASTPECCQECYYPGMVSLVIARKVIDGEIEESQAISELREDIEHKCTRGLLRIEGICFGNNTERTYNQLRPIPNHYLFIKPPR